MAVFVCAVFQALCAPRGLLLHRGESEVTPQAIFPLAPQKKSHGRGARFCAGALAVCEQGAACGGEGGCWDVGRGFAGTWGGAKRKGGPTQLGPAWRGALAGMSRVPWFISCPLAGPEPG